MRGGRDSGGLARRICCRAVAHAVDRSSALTPVFFAKDRSVDKSVVRIGLPLLPVKVIQEADEPERCIVIHVVILVVVIVRPFLHVYECPH